MKFHQIDACYKKVVDRSHTLCKLQYVGFVELSYQANITTKFNQIFFIEDHQKLSFQYQATETSRRTITFY